VIEVVVGGGFSRYSSIFAIISGEATKNAI
jgi:hypothetical protein